MIKLIFAIPASGMSFQLPRYRRSYQQIFQRHGHQCFLFFSPVVGSYVLTLDGVGVPTSSITERSPS
ncbi:hypothetical protein [Pseudogulbenkiania sp. MAI-1]|uniref:hypothetical protein n=1 Tax=Pseudogulbenkiania sp. MAI-1 TaxID=990370 RepID=UPI0012EB99E9|nr:hypothetical protein [Pseudogulbenkiania sp. MAI-1]